MKNWEKYEEELRKIGVNLFALIDGEPRKCSGSYCRDCEFHKQNPINGSCSHERTKWLYQDDGIRVGDVDRENVLVENPLAYVTPVPKGVGLLTRVALLKNVYNAYMNNVEM